MDKCHKNHGLSYYIPILVHPIYLPKLCIVAFNTKVKPMLINVTQSKTLFKPRLNSH
jgi:hypothetical protein